MVNKNSKLTVKRVLRNGHYYGIVFKNGKFTKIQVKWAHEPDFNERLIDLYRQITYIPKKRPPIEPIRKTKIIKTSKLIKIQPRIRQKFPPLPEGKFYKATLIIILNKGKGSGINSILHRQEMHLRFKSYSGLRKILMQAFSKVKNRDFMEASFKAHEKGHTGLYIQAVNPIALEKYLKRDIKALIKGFTVDYKNMSFELSLNPTNEDNNFKGYNEWGTIAERVKKEEVYGGSSY